MIVGVGTDIVDLQRLQALWRRFPERLPEKILTAEERETFKTLSAKKGAQKVLFLGGRWAAKEALAKALGSGIRAPVLRREFGVGNDAAGRPYFQLSPALQAFLTRRRIGAAHLSIAHDGGYAVATVVAESAAEEE